MELFYGIDDNFVKWQQPKIKRWMMVKIRMTI
jgi:hypothetical protein